MPTADEIAGALLAREAASAQHGHRRQIASLAITVAVAAAVVFVPRAIHPVAEVALEISHPAVTQQLDVIGPQSMQQLRGRAQMRALAVDALPEPGASTGIVELVLPTSPGNCAKLAAELGGACGIRARPHRQPAGNVTIESTQTAELEIASTDLHSATVEGNAVTHAIVQVAAPVTILTLLCRVPGERLRITTPSRTLDTTRCQTPASGILRLALEYPAPPLLTLTTLGALHLQLPGNEATLTTSQAAFAVGGERQSLALSSPVPVVYAPHRQGRLCSTADAVHHDRRS